MDLTVVNLFFAGSGVRWVFAGIFGWVSCLFAREELGGCSEGCSEGREELGGCSEGCSFAREIYGCRNTGKSVPPFCHCHVRVCFLNSSEVGSLGSGRAWRLVCLLGKNWEVARKVARLLGRFMDVEIPVSQFPLSVIAMFVLVSLIHSEELGNRVEAV